MHPDIAQLAAYLDGALSPTERTTLRGHILSCATCAARLGELRADAERITATLATVPTPDLRANVRGQLRRKVPLFYLGRSAALASALLVVLLLAILASVSSGAFSGEPDRLFVADYMGAQLIVLDAESGATIKNVSLPAKPTRLRYNPANNRLYALVTTGVLAIDPRTLAIVEHWQAPQPISVNADLVLDTAQDKLYVTLSGSIAVLKIDTLQALDSLETGPSPGPLALAANGHTLLALDTQEATLWTIDLDQRRGTAQLLSNDDIGRQGWLAIGNDGRVLVLRSGHPPMLWQRSPNAAPVALSDGASPRDLLALTDGRLAIARGDGHVGGVEIITSDGEVHARIDPGYDQHRLVTGSGDALFALNWLHSTVTRYSLRRGARVWHVELPGKQPWDAAFVSGGWRLP